MSQIDFKKNLLEIQDELLRYALKLTCNREEANDLLQETTLKALDNEARYSEDTNFKGWAYTIMYNIFINNYRKNAREQLIVDNTDQYYITNSVHDVEGDNTESSYDMKEIRRIVNSLESEYRAPFSLHILGYKYKEIAEKLNMPIGTVKSRIYFTRQKLQAELKDFR